MNYYHWCGICERTAVLHHGDTCLRCTAAIEAIIYPSDRIVTYRPAPSRGLRFLRWLAGATR